MIKGDDIGRLGGRDFYKIRQEVEEKIQNAWVRGATLKGNGSCFGQATILKALDEKWDYDYPREYSLFTYKIPIGKKFVERQIVVSNDLFLEDYGCSDLELCEKGLKEIFGKIPELVSKETISLFSDDITILYDNIKTLAEDLLGDVAANEMFDNFEAEHKYAECEEKEQTVVEENATVESLDTEKKTVFKTTEKTKVL